MFITICIWIAGGRIAWLIVPKIFDMMRRVEQAQPKAKEIIWEKGFPQGRPCSFYENIPVKRK